MSAGPRIPRALILAAALGLGAWLRLRGLADLPLHGDEYHTLTLADASYGRILTTFDGVGSHVPLPLLQRIALDLFGPGVIAFRLAAIVPGLLLLALAHPLLRRFAGPDGAALAMLALALDPMVVFYARFARGYSLALLLALVLASAVLRVLDAADRRRSAWVALVSAAALLPWVHLSTLGFVGALAVAAIVLAARESRALALAVAGSFALAGVIALLLFAPLRGEVVRYFREMQPEPAPLSWWGVPTLLFGSRAGVVVWLVLFAAGCAQAWRERRAAVVLTLAGLAGPLVLLLSTRPRGLDYAWARYLLSVLPCVFALGAAALVGLGRRFARHGGALALAGGAVLLLAQHAYGPLGRRAAPDGSFSNTYLALHRLPAFDVPFPGVPGIYHELARDPSVRTIVEYPPVLTRAVLALRNHALLHRKRVLIGWTGELPRGIQAGPYARLLEIEPERADWVLLHRAPLQEIPAYFRFVFDQAWPALRDAADEGFMLRQESIHPGNLPEEDLQQRIAARLGERFGPPSYQDEWILAWRLVE
jgi:hypothetical protein